MPREFWSEFQLPHSPSPAPDLAIRCKSPQCQEELLYPTQQFSVITSSAPIEFAIPLPVPKESGVLGRDDRTFAVVVREILLRNQRDFTSDLPRTHTKQAKKKKKRVCLKVVEENLSSKIMRQQLRSSKIMEQQDLRSLLRIRSCVLVVVLLAAAAAGRDSRAEAAVLEYDWVVGYLAAAPDCVEKMVIAINGQFPSPTIHAVEGDTLVVKLKNNLPTEGVSIHWHGIRQRGTPFYDGSAFVSQCPINPGETFTYKFVVDRVKRSRTTSFSDLCLSACCCCCFPMCFLLSFAHDLCAVNGRN